jgi:DNA-directed RNA polymerase subunit delta
MNGKGVCVVATQKLSEYKPMLERFFEQLEGAKQPRTFYEIADQIVDKNMETEEKGEILARLYTNIILDGRFLSLGDNFWGLKRWYPIEQREEDVAMTLAPKRKKKKADDDFDDYDDDLEDYDELDLTDDLDEDDEEDIVEGFKKSPVPVSDLDATGDFEDDDNDEEETIGDAIIDLEDEDDEDDEEDK